MPFSGHYDEQRDRFEEQQKRIDKKQEINIIWEAKKHQVAEPSVFLSRKNMVFNLLTLPILPENIDPETVFFIRQWRVSEHCSKTRTDHWIGALVLKEGKFVAHRYLDGTSFGYGG